MTHHFSFTSNPKQEPHLYCSIIDVLRKNVEEFKDFEICVHKHIDGSRTTLTYKELQFKAEKFAHYLISKGIQKGNHVALVGPNSMEWIIAEFGIMIARGVAVHTSLQVKDSASLLEMLTEIECKGVVFDPGNENRKSPLIEQMNELFGINNKTPKESSVVVLLNNSDQTSFLSIQNIISLDLLTSDLPVIYPDDTAVIFVTSGSTGRPKMAEMTHFAIVNASSRIPPICGTSVNDVIVYNDRPFSWVGGTPLLYILRREKRVFTDTVLGLRGDHTTFLWQTIKDEKCTHCLLLPFVLMDLIQNQEELKKMNYQMKVISTGGQMICSRFSDIIGNFCEKFVVLYGSTEVNIITHGKPLMIGDKIELGNVGKPFPGVEIRIADDMGRPVPTGELGEIQVRSHFSMKGYFGNSKLNELAFLDGKWFKTGDIGIIDQEGQLIMRGKSKDIIKRGTEKVMSGYIEGVTQNMNGIQESVVFGVPDARLSEQVCVCYVCKENYFITPDDISEYCKQEFGEAQGDTLGNMPGYFLKFDSFPRLNTGKPDKVMIKRKAEQLLRL